MSTINVAIDGPAGAGKSTIAKMAAAKKEFIYVDTGAMFRAIALHCSRLKIKAKDKENIIKASKKASVEIKYIDGEQKVILNGEDVNAFIRTEEISQMTSTISAYPEVRKILLGLQRDIAAKNNVIMDGRDIGSNVLPNADVKIYLTASVETRAMRRYKEQIEKGYDVSLENIKEDIEKRDYQDMHRECAPLTIAEGAYVLDSSDMSIEEVVEEIISRIDGIK